MRRIPKRAGEQELKERGQYDEYVAEKERLIGEGLHPKLAEQDVLKKYLGEGWRPNGQGKKVGAKGNQKALSDGDIDIGEIEDRRGSYFETVQWVSKNIGVRKKAQLTDYPPSREAVAILQAINDGELTKRDFLVNIWTRIAAAKMGKEFEDETQSGGAVLELIERIERKGSSSILPPSTEEFSQEFEIPPMDD